MLTPPPGLKVLVATKPIEFRKGADGLAALAQEVLKQNPLSGTALIFRAKRADRVKILVWDGSGLVLYWKRLENGAFKWPPVTDGVMRMNAAQLAALLSGMDWKIGADESQRLDVVPAQLRVIVTRRLKFARGACPGSLVQAPAPERLIKGGLPTLHPIRSNGSLAVTPWAVRREALRRALQYRRTRPENRPPFQGCVPSSAPAAGFKLATAGRDPVSLPVLPPDARRHAFP